LTPRHQPKFNHNDIQGENIMNPQNSIRISEKLSLGLLTLISAFSIHAAPASTESVERLLLASKIENIAESAIPMMKNLIRQKIAENPSFSRLNEKQKQVVADGMSKAIQILTEESTWEKVRPIYVKAYQENFSQEEVDSIVVFYESPAGMALASRLPLVNTQLMQGIAPTMSVTNEKLSAHMKQMAAEVQAAKDDGKVSSIESVCPKQVAPEIPRRAIKDRVEGTVMAQIRLKDGVVGEVTILSGPGVFHDSVRAAIAKYECNQKPGEVVAQQTFNFKIGGPAVLPSMKALTDTTR
jgi:hypothetical protein